MKLTSLLLCLTLFFSSCSHVGFYNPNKETIQTTRLPANELSEIAYYLSVDKFKYYLNEYSVAMEGKISNEIITYLRALSVQEILDMNFKLDDLKDAANYDKIIWKLAKEEGITKGTTEAQAKWGYNFFKNKLNEAFNLAPSKLNINLSLPSQSEVVDHGMPLKLEVISADDMTLDSGHYISNRTTRAIFWDANINQRPIEFHLGDSREFLKELKDKNGEILFEVKPFAKNYNKIYIIKYPNEATYRYAITNIGGQDRLDHLTHQISLSNFNSGKLATKITVKGDIKKFHASKAEEHAMQLRLLPSADRVIIGQKESIDGKFNLFWKMAAASNLYEKDNSLFDKRVKSLDSKTTERFFALMSGVGGHEAVFKDKKVIEDVYALLEDDLAKNPKLLPEKFKIYNYDNFTIEMCDYVFAGNNGKETRWRVVSNVWGDEIIPIAEAFKMTGHTNVTYMGTAGAFDGKGYKVGDLVAPKVVLDGDKALPMTGTPMKIEGAKYEGTVEHVGSPFEESHDWLKKAKARSEFVEVETSYLRRIFSGPQDKLEIFLLISDILGSETETLAHATSSKRKNAQNKLLATLFTRDAKVRPTPIAPQLTTEVEKIKALVFKTLEKRTAAFRHYIFSLLKNEKNVTVKRINDLAEEVPVFTDTYLLDRLVKASEVAHSLRTNYPDAGNFEVAVSKSLIEGTFNPKSDKLHILIKTKDAKAKKVVESAFSDNKSFLDSIKSFATFSTDTAVNDPELVWMKAPDRIDPDFLVKVYTFAGFSQSGLYKNVTYNGNLTLDFLPTTKTQNPFAAFYQGAAPAGVDGGCVDIMKSFLKIIY